MRQAVIWGVAGAVWALSVQAQTPAEPARPMVKTTTSAGAAGLSGGTAVAPRTVTSSAPALQPGEKLADAVIWPKWPTDEARAGLIEVSRWLGQAHFLNVLCVGRSDQTWRMKAQTILDRDARSDPTLRAAMIEAFNTGYTALEGDYPACTPEVAEVEAETRKRASAAASAVAKRARAHLKAVAAVASEQRTSQASPITRKIPAPEVR